MKVIVKALRETDYRPRKGWWGYCTYQMNYLMRYGHIMLEWTPGKVHAVFAETRTDIAGVNYAIELIETMDQYDFKYRPLCQLEFLLEEAIKEERYEHVIAIQKEMQRQLS